MRTPKPRTDQRNSMVRVFVILGLRPESLDESQSFLVNGRFVCAAWVASSNRYAG
jgi:hypothetical protein